MDDRQKHINESSLSVGLCFIHLLISNTNHGTWHNVCYMKKDIMNHFEESAQAYRGKISGNSHSQKWEIFIQTYCEFHKAFIFHSWSPGVVSVGNHSMS